MWGLFRLLLLFLLSVEIALAGQSLPTGVSSAESRAEDSAAQTTVGQPGASQGSTDLGMRSIPVYPDSSSGLESFFNDMLDLWKRGDKASLAPYFQSFLLPHPETWFPSKFGDEHCENKQMGGNDCLGSRLALTYASTLRTLPAAAAMTVSDLLGEGLTNFEAVNYSEHCSNPQRIIPARKLVGDLTTTPILSPVLSGLVRNHEPVYVLWAYSETKETTLAFFVYADGGFRYIGMPHPASPEDFARKTATPEGAIGADQSINNPPPSDDLTNEVLDVQPVLADQSLVQRTVVLYVLIGTDGKVSEASYVRGPEELKDAAIQSVKGRKFEPVSIGGYSLRVVATCVNIEVPR